MQFKQIDITVHQARRILKQHGYRYAQAKKDASNRRIYTFFAPDGNEITLTTNCLRTTALRLDLL